MGFLEVRRDGPGRAVLMRWHSKRGDLLTQAAVTSKGLGPQKLAPHDTDDGVVNGGFGVWNDSWIPDETTTIRDSRLFLSRKGGRKVDLGIPSPVPASPSRKYVGLVIRNSRMIAARAGAGTVYVWTPRTKKWIACSLPEETAGSHVALRPFDSWILGLLKGKLERRVGGGFKDSPGRAQRLAIAPDPSRPWYEAPSGKFRPNVEYRLQFTGHTFPGILYAIDSVTGRVISVKTGQGDSEPLAVRNEVLYYRVNDQLYASRIHGARLDPPVLLARHEAIPEVHWAFFR
jgi:hypothetical protein